MASLHAQLQSAARSAGRLSTGDEPIGSVQACPECGEPRTLSQVGEGRYSLRLWSDCSCVARALAEAERARADAATYARRRAQERIAQQLGLSRVQGMVLDTFDPALLTSDADTSHPYHYALRWVAGVRGESVGNYHSGPPVALFFHSRGKGRGKTHLAAGIAWQAYDWGYLAAFVEETSYLSRYYAEDFESRDELQTLLGDRAWLTVIDDLGQAPPAKKDGSSGAAKAWYDIVNRRWLKRGWTIITSNRTLEELVDQGTINDATYSRLYQMTRGQMVVFDGVDYRLEGAR